MEVLGLSRVCHENFTSKKSMISTTLKHQNWVEPLSGSNLTKFLENLLLLFYVRNIYCNERDY